MKKPYVELQADVLLLLTEDVITTSIGDDHGMEGEVVEDQFWEVF